MAAVKFEDVMSQLKSGKFAPVYLLMGEEPFYIDCISDYIENNALPESDRDFNQVVLYGRDTTPDEVVANAKQFAFGADHRVVILKEAKDLPQIDLLTSYFANPQPSTILVVCYKYGKLKPTQYKGCDKSTVIYTSEPVRDYQLAAWVQKQAALHNFKLSSEAAGIISENIGNDLARINNEFKKLKIILPEGTEITPEIIEKNIGISKEYNIFELQNALGERDADKAFKICINFTHNMKDNPNVKTIAVLYNFYSKMLAYMLLPDNSDENLAKVYGKINPFVMNINRRYASRYSLAQVRRIISVLREYDVKSKGVDSDAPGEELLMEMIYKILH